MRVENVICGLDLGKYHDPSAVVTVEVVQAYEYCREGVIVLPVTKPVGDRVYRVVHIERPELGTDYHRVRERVAAIMRNLENHYGIRPALVLDATAIGELMFEEFEKMDIKPTGIVSSGGFLSNRVRRNVYSVPKLDLVNVAEILTLSNRLAVNERLPLARILRKELATFRRKITAAGHVTGEHEKTTDHDDILLAMCMALWYGERGPGRRRPLQGITKTDLGL